jgi:HD-like signal output (HDOD) protein
LHDVGAMVLFNSDPRGFEQVVEEARQEEVLIVKKESKQYGFDHTAVGVALLDFWNIDNEVSEAVLVHHRGGDNSVGSLASIIDMADLVCERAELGLFGELPNPGAAMLRASGCEDEESLAELTRSVREAYDQESALFRAA